MIVGYARVSTLDQNAELQVDALRAAGCEKVFIEHKTGSNRERPELNRCLEILRSGDQLIVWRLDRLGRSLKDLIDLVTESEKNGVGFQSLNESINTVTPTGKLIFHVFGALSEFERSLIQERTKAGLEAARARGRKGGRPKKMNTSQARNAKAMLIDPTITKTEVARHFNVSRVTLNSALAALEKRVT